MFVGFSKRLKALGGLRIGFGKRLHGAGVGYCFVVAP